MLVGNRITLLPACVELAQRVCDYYVTNAAFLRGFEPRRSAEFFTLHYQAQEMAQEELQRADRRGYRFFIVSNDKPKDIIGTIALNNVVWRAFLSCYLGYALDEAHQNQGLMTEAVSLITDFAFTELGLHRIEANVMPRNKASLRVLEKCGYKNEGLSPRYLAINGVWEDHIHMVRLNEGMYEGGQAEAWP